MTRDEESQALSAIHASSGSRRDFLKQEFAIKYKPLAGHWAKRYLRKFRNHYELQDLFQVAFMAILECIEDYQSGKGASFKTFASQAILRDYTSLKRSIPREEWLPDENKVIDDREEIDLKFYFAESHPADRLLVRLSYGWGCEKMSQDEIAKILGMTRRQVKLAIDRAMELARS